MCFAASIQLISYIIIGAPSLPPAFPIHPAAKSRHHHHYQHAHPVNVVLRHGTTCIRMLVILTTDLVLEACLIKFMLSYLLSILCYGHYHEMKQEW